jgi:hypothetical protein
VIAWLKRLLVTVVVGGAAFAIVWYALNNPEEASEVAMDIADVATDLLDDDDDDHVFGDDDDDGDDGEEESRVEIVDGVPVVALEDEDRDRAGVETAILEAVQYRPEILAKGLVVDIQPLLAHRGTCLSAINDVEMARTRLGVARREYQRLSDLNAQGGSIATKRVQEAEAQVRIERVAVAGAETRRDTLIDEARQGWGPEVAGWLLEDDPTTLQGLIMGEQVLVQLVMPVGTTMPPNVTDVSVSAARGDDRERPATYVSPAPYTDPMIQGESHFFRADSSGLRAGMQTVLRIPIEASPRTGVIVPDAAVVWALGQSWAYLALDEEHFARIAVATDIERPDGWFVSDGIAPGETIVVTGAQTLYAEEFRWQVFEEDDD